MENTYLIKVNEESLKKILKSDISNFEMVELESIDDIVKFNFIVELMKKIPLKTLIHHFGSRELAASNRYTIETSSVLSVNNTKYYDINEVHDMLKSILLDKSFTSHGASIMRDRVLKLLQKINIEHSKIKKEKPWQQKD